MSATAGVCSTCGKHAEKLYGGNGRYPVECERCWFSFIAHDGLELEVVSGQEDERRGP